MAELKNETGLCLIHHCAEPAAEGGSACAAHAGAHDVGRALEMALALGRTVSECSDVGALRESIGQLTTHLGEVSRARFIAADAVAKQRDALARLTVERAEDTSRRAITECYVFGNLASLSLRAAKGDAK